MQHPCLHEGQNTKSSKGGVWVVVSNEAKNLCIEQEPHYVNRTLAE